MSLEFNISQPSPFINSILLYFTKRNELVFSVNSLGYEITRVSHKNIPTLHKSWYFKGYTIFNSSISTKLRVK